MLRNSPRLSSVRGFGSTLVTPPTEHNLYLASLWNGVMASLTIKPPSSGAAAGDKLIGSSLNIQPQPGLLLYALFSVQCSVFSVMTDCQDQEYDKRHCQLPAGN